MLQANLLISKYKNHSKFSIMRSKESEKNSTDMANDVTLPLILLSMATLISSVTPANIPSKNQNLLVAIEEMRKANYFTFVMLINMSPLDQKISENVTFFMPNDKTLARTNMLQESVSDFLLRHSIPSVLLFEHLELIPSGSLIPSSLTEYMLNISNGGRRNFFLNNVKIISPNICTTGSSIRCHGIDGVLTFDDNNRAHPPFFNSSSPVVAAEPPTALPVPQMSAPPVGDPNQTPPIRDSDQQAPSFGDSNQAPSIAPLPPYVHSQKSSGSSQWLAYGGLVNFFATFAMMAIMGVSVL